MLTAVMVYPKKEGVRKAQDIPNAVEQEDENKQRLLELLKILFIKNLVIEDKMEQLQKTYGILTVSYTHLDVYKRKPLDWWILITRTTSASAPIGIASAV